MRAAVCEVRRKSDWALISLLKMPARGFIRGAVDDVSEATHSFSQVLSEIKKISPRAIKNILLGLATPDVKVLHSRGVVAVSRADDEIYEDDINRVLESAKAVSIPDNRAVLEWITQEFIVDGLDNIHDPLGMIGKRLEANLLAVHSFTPAIKSIQRCIETLGGKVVATTVSPIAASQAVLSKNQMELGVVLVDIGFATTGLCIYEENRFVHTTVLPIGSGSITNDLAIGLRIPIETAEVIKLSYGSALSKEVPARDTIELEKIDPRVKGVATKRFISEIIESRFSEIFDEVNTEIKRVGKANQLPAGAVLIGAGAKMPNLVELARRELKLPAQIGLPDISRLTAVSSEISLLSEDPEFATALGLVLSASHEELKEERMPRGNSGLLKKLLNYFIP